MDGQTGGFRFKRALVLGLTTILGAASCASEQSERVQAEQGPAEPGAGTWKPWVLSSAAEIRVPPPPGPGSQEATSDLDKVRAEAARRTPEVRAAVKKWGGPVPMKPWSETAMDFVSKSSKNPPLSSRNYALVHVAMYDAVLSAWHWKYEYNVKPPEDIDTVANPGPDPSYPSEHAAMAGAASKVLAHLYPAQSALRLDEMAEQAAQSRVQAGTNTPSDVAAGLELGRKVAEKVIAYSNTDGADKKWDGKRPPGIGSGPAFWEPPPGTASPPTEPLAGTWKPWVLASGDQFRPGPPPAFGSPEFRTAAQEIVDIQKNLTEDQKRIARFWAGTEGTPLPAGIVLNEAIKDVEEAATTGPMKDRMTVPRMARALALLNIVMADGGISAWDAKFTYWNPRPENAIRDLGLDPNWKPLVDTPRFPAYPSGSAGYAGSSEAVLSYLFPEKAAEFRRRAEEQAISRLYAGIHWRYDRISIEGGREIGALVIERAKKDGADG